MTSYGRSGASAHGLSSRESLARHHTLAQNRKTISISFSWRSDVGYGFPSSSRWPRLAFSDSDPRALPCIASIALSSVPSASRLSEQLGNRYSPGKLSISPYYEARGYTVISWSRHAGWEQSSRSCSQRDLKRRERPTIRLGRNAVWSAESQTPLLSWPSVHIFGSRGSCAMFVFDGRGVISNVSVR